MFGQGRSRGYPAEAEKIAAKTCELAETKHRPARPNWSEAVVSDLAYVIEIPRQPREPEAVYVHAETVRCWEGHACNFEGGGYLPVREVCFVPCSPQAQFWLGNVMNGGTPQEAMAKGGRTCHATSVCGLLAMCMALFLRRAVFGRSPADGCGMCAGGQWRFWLLQILSTGV